MKKIVQSLLLTFLVGSFQTLFAQQNQVHGVVIDSEKQPVAFCTILVKGTQQGTVANAFGEFTLMGVQAFPITIIVRALGYSEEELLVASAKAATKLNIQLAISDHQLSDVTITGKGIETRAKEQAFTVAAIDAKPLQAQNLEAKQLLSRMSGIRIRETGGLGSSNSFSLNGFTGKQVKFFLDGVSMDYFGNSLSISNIPVNMISSIEVYKGVVPIHLGADALGGAVNINTNNTGKNFLNASYSFGSFNTHKVSVLANYNLTGSLFFKTNLFLNASDNNYTMYDMEVIKIGNTSGKPEIMDVERFHDAYQSNAATFELGLKNKIWADVLSVGVSLSSSDNEIQHGYNTSQVYGEVRATDHSLMPTLKYEKSDLLLPNLDVKLNALTINRQITNVDTASISYNWLGESSERINANYGEFSYFKTLLTYDDRVTLANFNANYGLNERGIVSLNNSFNRFSRKGINPLVDEDFTPFFEPNIITKNISAVSYTFKTLDEHLSLIGFYKLFNVAYHTIIEDEYEDYTLSYDETLFRHGYGMAATYRLTKAFQLKTSYEHTYRLPDGEEIFGDGLTIRPNTELRPEQSNNFNVGVFFQKAVGIHAYQFEAAYLFRTAKDYIRQDAANPVRSKFINEAAVKLNSFELSGQYRYKKLLTVNASGTYQHNINNNPDDKLFGDQLPNQPTLFANGNVMLMFPHFGKNHDQVSLIWNTLFVDEFYWKWPSQGNASSKLAIPQQLLHDLSVSYKVFNGKCNIALACNNLTNARAYDNFRLQKPGRSFNIKISTFISE